MLGDYYYLVLVHKLSVSNSNFSLQYHDEASGVDIGGVRRVCGMVLPRRWLREALCHRQEHESNSGVSHNLRNTIWSVCGDCSSLPSVHVQQLRKRR